MARTRATRRRGRRRRPARRNNYGEIQQLQKVIKFPFTPLQRCGPLARFFQQIQQLKEKKNIEEFQFDLKPSEISYENKIAPSMCTRRINSIFWECYTCYSNENQVFCEACFDLQAHKGHYYMAVNSQEPNFCACGRNGIDFCADHNPEKSNPIINEEETDELKQYLRQLFDLFSLFFTLPNEIIPSSSSKSQKLIKFLTEEIERICEQNLVALNVANKVLLQEIDPAEVDKKKGVTRSQLLLTRNKNSELIGILKPLFGSEDFLFEFLRILIVKKIPIQHFLRNDGVVSKNVLFRLAEQNIVSTSFEACYTTGSLNEMKKRSRSSREGNLYLKYLEKVKLLLAGKPLKDFIQRFIATEIKFMNKQLHQFLLKNCFQYFEDYKYKLPAPEKEKSEQRKEDRGMNEDEKSEVKEEREAQDNENQEGEGEEGSQGEDENEQNQSSSSSSEEQEEESAEDKDQASNEYLSSHLLQESQKILNSEEKSLKRKKLTFQKSRYLKVANKINGYNIDICSFINKTLIEMIDNDLGRVSEINQILQSIGLDEEKISQYKLLCMNLFEIGKKQATILPLLWLLESEEKDSCDKLWFKIFKEQGQSSFQNVISYISNLFSEIAEFPHIIRQKKIERESSLEEMKRYFPEQRKDFSSFLFESKKYNASNLWTKKIERFDFDGVEEILKEHCYYNEEDEEFVYTSAKQYPDYLHKIQIMFGEDYNTNNYLKITDKPEIEDFTTLSIFKFLFSSEYLSKIILFNKFKKFLKEVEEDEGMQEDCRGENTIQKYLQILILIWHFHPEAVDKQIHKIQNDTDYRFKFVFLSNEEKIMEQLDIKVKKSEQEEVKEVEEKQNKQEKELEKLKEKMQKKKKQKLEAMKKTQRSVLEVMRTKSMDVAEQELCMTCHESEKINNQFVYLAMINKDSTLSSCIHGDNNKGAVNIQTCFHKVHVNCFEKMNHRNSSFPCPYCSQNRNCIFPTRFISHRNRTFKMCCNFLIASLVRTYNILDLQSIFMFLFKHMIENYSLAPLVSMNREIRKSSKQKVNNFILNFLIEMFEKGSEAEKEDYLIEMDGLMKEIETCSKKEAGDVQMLVAECIKSEIIGKKSEVSTERLETIQEVLNNEEFLVVKDQLEEITKQQIEIKKPTESGELKEPKKPILSFTPMALPNNAIDLSTFGKPKCDRCIEMSQSICLICGLNLCNNCQGSNKHREEHRKKVLLFFREEAELNVESVHNHQTESVYENPFKRNIYEMRSTQETFKTTYTLKEDTVERLLKKFYDEDV